MSAEFLALHETVPFPHDFEVGRIQGIAEVSPSVLKIPAEAAPAQITQCDVYNPNVAYLRAVKPGRYEEIQSQEGKMDAISRLNFRNWRRKEQVAYEQSGDADSLDSEDSTAFGDTESRRRFFGEGGLLGDPALRLWREMIPSASALTPLVNPFNTGNITRVENGVVAAEAPTTDTTKEWMTACTDGQEIFNRSAILVEEMGSFIGKYAAQHPGERMTVVSVAGGTALGTMQAILRSGVDPQNVRLMLLEGNPDSVDMAFDLAARIGFPAASIDWPHRLAANGKRIGTDVFSPADMAQVKRDLDATGEKVVAVDAVGIVEYSNAKLRSRSLVQKYGEDYMLYNPEAFIATCLNLASEEGMAIVGQMRSDRPRRYFTRGVVSWPTICMRSPAVFAQLLKESGADMDLAKFSLTPRNTYTMATLYKSEQAALLAGFAPAENRANVVSLRQALLARLHAAHHTGAVAIQSD